MVPTFPGALENATHLRPRVYTRNQALYLLCTLFPHDLCPSDRSAMPLTQPPPGPLAGGDGNRNTACGMTPCSQGRADLCKLTRRARGKRYKYE